MSLLAQIMSTFGGAAVHAWAMSANLVGSRQSSASCGTTAAALVTGGALSYGCETFNGTVWATGPAMGYNISQHGAVGTASDCLAFGGNSSGPASTAAKFNGVSWASTVPMGWASSNLSGIGAGSASSIALGGVTTGSTPINYVDYFNGTAWAALTGMNQIHSQHVSCGATNTGLVITGLTTGGVTSTAVEKFNGSAWTTTGANTTQPRVSGGAAGNSSAAIAFGGSTSSQASDLWNGATFSVGGSINVARLYLSGCGSNLAALAVGGALIGGTVLSSTEIYR